jgi:SAM-dependent methyltransferase
MSRQRSGAAAQLVPRNRDYYGQARPEVAELVPPECRRVLDVGCAAGQLGALLRARGHYVAGIELSPNAAEQARHLLDHVEVRDVEAEGFPFEPESFDAILFADVLEHLVDPWRVLREAASLLVPGGRVIASIPNLQNAAVLRRLIRGRWQYRERGITDFGHLRFFTLHTIRHLFQQAGLRLVHVGYQYRRTWPRSLACLLTAGAARVYLARQFLLVAVRET